MFTDDMKEKKNHDDNITLSKIGYHWYVCVVHVNILTYKL